MTIKVNRCNRCDHEWAQRSNKLEPKTCPRCKSPYWDKPRIKKVA